MDFSRRSIPSIIETSLPNFSTFRETLEFEICGLAFFLLLDAIRFPALLLTQIRSLLFSPICLEDPVPRIHCVKAISINSRSVTFMNVAAHLRRICFLQSFSVVLLYWFYVFS